MPGIVDLSNLVAANSGVARIVLEAVQDMLLRVALQSARDDYGTRRERQREEIEIAKRAGRYEKPASIVVKRDEHVTAVSGSSCMRGNTMSCPKATIKIISVPF